MGADEVGFAIEVGRLKCRDVREMLKVEQFRGSSIRFIEGSGWLSRTFAIMGKPEHVAAFRDRLFACQWYAGGEG